jgi:hypothetical protein
MKRLVLCLLLAVPVAIVSVGCGGDEPTVAIDTRTDAEIAAENAAYEEEQDIQDEGE